LSNYDFDGHFIGVNVRIGDGNGTIPDSIAALTVTGPGGFSYTFKPSDYNPDNNEYFYRVSGTLLDGLYTFTATNDEENTVATHHYHKQGEGTIPLLDESSFEVSGDPLTPTISWSAVAGYASHLYYRVHIVDDQGKTVYHSSEPYSPYTYRTISSGYLVSGKSYTYRVEAMDAYRLQTYNNRTNSSFHGLAQTAVSSSFNEILTAQVSDWHFDCGGN